MLALGLMLVLIGVFVKVGMVVPSESVFAWRPVTLLCAGVVCLFVAFAVMQSGLVVFVGLLSFLCGLVVLLVEAHIVPRSYDGMWPAFLIATGLALFPAGLYRLKRLRTIYLFPAISMVVLGCVFLLFSLHVVPMTFGQFMVQWWPLLLVGGGLALVIIFVVQQVNSKDFPYLEDDSLVDGDDN